jgi:hypothetical protein
MVTETKQIGSLVCDTGVIMMCDPNFAEDFRPKAFDGKREYTDTQTQIVYTFGKDFQKYNEIVLDGKTVNELIQENRWVRIPYPETGEFTTNGFFRGIINQGFASATFADGRKGKALAVGTLTGDGEYPVFAEYQGEQIAKIWIDFTINLDDEQEE